MIILTLPYCCFVILQADVILVDIDGGHIFIPDTINLASLPEPFLGRTRHELTLVSLYDSSGQPCCFLCKKTLHNSSHYLWVVYTAHVNDSCPQYQLFLVKPLCWTYMQVLLGE